MTLPSKPNKIVIVGSIRIGVEFATFIIPWE